MRPMRPMNPQIDSGASRLRSLPWRRLAVGAFVWCALWSTASGALDAQESEAVTGTLSATVDPAEDRALADGLNRRFQQIEGLETVRASAEAGIVTLSGEVLEETDREEALTLARRVEGVARVEDDIEVNLQPLQRLRPALDEAFERLRILISYLPLLLVSFLLIGLFIFLSRIVGRLEAPFARITPNRFAQDLLRQAARIAVILVGVLIALEILDATALVGAVLGTAGVIGLAVGFAFRDLVENYISSILLSLRQPFSPNDLVEIDGREGKIVRLTSRATILMTLDGNHLRIPNSQVFKGVILNYSRNPRRRFDFGVGVGVGEDLQIAQRLGIEALNEMDGVLEDPPPMALIEELGDSNVLLRFYGWVNQDDVSFPKVKSEAIRRVKTILEDAGMDLPEPIYRVHMVEPGPAEAPEVSVDASPDLRAEDAADIAKDDHLELQIEEDRRDSSSGDDLLEESAAKE